MFSFAVQYFGYFGQDYGGYQVIMIDKIYDDPNDYWKLMINSKDAQVGIESYMVNVGDVIEFDYAVYTPAIHDATVLKSKLDFYKN